MWLDYDVPNKFPTLKNFQRSKWPPKYCTNSTLSDFNDISYVGRLRCPELIPDIEKCIPVVIFKMAATMPHKFNIVRFQRHFICGQIMMSRIDSRHRKISTGRHFQNGRHNTAQIQHCSIAKVAFNLFFKPVVSDRFGRLHNRQIIIISCNYSYSYSYFYSYSLSLSPFFRWHMNLSTADLGNYWTEFHESWWSYRYVFLVGPLW